MIFSLSLGKHAPVSKQLMSWIMALPAISSHDFDYVPVGPAIDLVILEHYVLCIVLLDAGPKGSHTKTQQ